VSISKEHYFYLMEINEELKYVIDKIRAIRIKKGISQMELSLLSNLSQSFIANLEKGKKQPSVLTLLKIAAALNVNPQDFFPLAVNPDSKDHIKEKIYKLLEVL